MNFEVPWIGGEAEVLSYLIDDELNDPFHILDFLDAHAFVELAEGRGQSEPVLKALEGALEYVNSQLRENENVFPESLLRTKKFPRIRQMRDVHQFDVGSHLGFCYILTRRNAPATYAAQHGLEAVSAHLDAIHQASVANSELEIAAIFHDFFKAFRSRRVLPSKLGKTTSLAWTLPNGTAPSQRIREDEGAIAAASIAHFHSNEAEAARIGIAIEESTVWGSALYGLLGCEPAEAETQVRGTLDQFAETASAAGLYTGLIDWLGKGWALDVLTIRKSRKLTLREAGLVALAEVNRVLLET